MPVAGRKPQARRIGSQLRAVLRGSNVLRGYRAGVTREDLNWDLGHGYLQIFPDSLGVEVPADTAADGGLEARTEPTTALLKEFARMRLKILPKKGDLRDLNNWRGIMLLDAASKVVSMIINSRLQLLLKEVGIEEQNGFMGGARRLGRHLLHPTGSEETAGAWKGVLGAVRGLGQGV